MPIFFILEPPLAPQVAEQSSRREQRPRSSLIYPAAHLFSAFTIQSRREEVKRR